MNISLCIAWFVFGFIVGQLVLIAIALMINDSRIEREEENGKRISEQSNNHINQDKQ